MGCKRYVISLLLLFLAHASAAQENIKTPWIFLDLGMTIIDTTDLEKLKYVKDSKEYLESLRLHGYQIGLILNIPETWGDTYDKKIETLKSFISERWVDDKTFDWSPYSKIIIPLKDAEKKPKPILFERAIQFADNCPLIYYAEDQNETEVDRASSLLTARKLFNYPQFF